MNLKVDRNSKNAIVCLVPVLLSLCLVAGAVYFSAVVLPAKKAETEARGGRFGRLKEEPAKSLAEAARRSKKDSNIPVLIFALTLTIPAVVLAYLFFRPGELPVLRTMRDDVAKSWGYDQSKVINPLGLTLTERKCLLSIVVSIFLSVSIVVWSIWYLSIS